MRPFKIVPTSTKKITHTVVLVIMLILAATCSLYIISKYTHTNTDKKHILQTLHNEHQLQRDYKTYQLTQVSQYPTFTSQESHHNYINKHIIMTVPIKELLFNKIDFNPNTPLTTKERTQTSGYHINKSTLQLSITGTYNSLGEYLFYLKTIPLLFTIESLKINRKNPQEPLELDIKMHFYHPIEKS